MGRWLPTVLAMAASGCIWIAGEEHDQRKADLAIEFELVTLNPGSWSTCAGTPTLSVAANVAGRHAGATFEAWYQFDDGVRFSNGQIIAGSQIQGLSTVTFELTPDPGVTVFDDCTDACETELTVGLSRLGAEDFASSVMQIVGEANPRIASGALVGPAGTETLASLPSLIQDNPTDSLSTHMYPTLALVIYDPVVQAGFGATVSVAGCPSGLDPVADLAQCIIVEATPSEVELDEGPALEVATASFATDGCALPQERWTFYAVIDDHPCGGPFLLDIAPGPFRFVHDDCDDDGYTVDAGDCDDDDPGVNPLSEEVWYNGIDEDCDGADDYDQDGDGVLSDQHGGTDCDDANDTIHPDAVEVCDDADNDCDGQTLADEVTIFPIAGPPFNTQNFQQAIDVAGAGDILQVCPGIFSGNFTVDKDLDIIGSGSVLSIIESVGSNQAVLTVAGGADVTLEGLQLTGATHTGGGQIGGGLDATDAGSIVGTDLWIIGNAAQAGGGAALDGTVTLIDSTIESNAADVGAGVDIRPGADVTFTNVIVQGNTATDSGGGLRIDDATLVLDATSEVRDNAALVGGGILSVDATSITGGLLSSNDAVDGGGIAFQWSQAGQPIAEVTDTLIEDHGLTLPIARGGGLFLVDSYPDIFVSGVQLTNNEAEIGGGLYARDLSTTQLGAFVVFEDTTVSANFATLDGGGAYVRDGWLWVLDGSFERNGATRDGAGVHMTNSGIYFPSVLATTFDSNVAGQYGGGAFLSGSVVLNYGYYVYAPAIFTANEAIQGGAAYVDDSFLLLADASATLNEATSEGGGFYVTGAGGHVGVFDSSNVSGNISQGNSSDGVFVDDGTFRSCDTVLFGDTLENAATTHGVPADPCFTLGATSYDPGVCVECP